jgi:hypothetical protein
MNSELTLTDFWKIGGPRQVLFFCLIKYTGKSLSEALIFVATNPQYDDNIASSEHA